MFKEYARSAFLSPAVADAVGDPFEFQKTPDPRAVSMYMLRDKLEVTDDTQMALFGLEGVTFAQEYQKEHPPHAWPDSFLEENIKSHTRMAYLRWYRTQTEKFAMPLSRQGLMSKRGMWKRKAPGNTCLSACNQLQLNKTVKNDSKGCGSVMRLLPFALMIPTHGYDMALRLAQHSAQLTHKHKDNVFAVTAYLRMAENFMGFEYNTALDEFWCGWFHGTSTHRTIEQAGFGKGGWTADSCVSMAVWAVANSLTYEELLVNSICHDGDSDSVAAVAGSLWGLMGRSGFEEAAQNLSEYSIIVDAVNRYADSL